MHRQVGLLLFGVASAFVHNGALAVETIEKNYFVLPITTEFQRAQLGGGVTAYAQIYSSGIARNGHIDAAAFDAASFRGDLAKLGGNSKGALMLYFRISGTNDKAPEAILLEAAVKQICRDAGFKQVRIGHMYTGDDWKEQLALINKSDPADDTAEERPTDSELVRVFPIRTRLSRFLTNDADCVIAVRRPIVGQQSALSEEIVASIQKCVAQLQLAHKRRILLSVMSTNAGGPVVERFTARNGDRPTEADTFAQKLGFESCNVQNSPCGGAPELLVDQPAPDFTLAALEGEPIHLQEFIRGKVAIVAFWGVACGPCCREAPHLSAAFEKYKDAGFTVVAVNAYDESKETISDFARKEKLTHPIALMGKKAAEDLYSVGAYPTCFWVDHNGKIVDYAVDFNPGDETRIDATIARMLRQRDKAKRSEAK